MTTVTDTTTTQGTETQVTTERRVISLDELVRVARVQIPIEQYNAQRRHFETLPDCDWVYE